MRAPRDDIGVLNLPVANEEVVAEAAIVSGRNHSSPGLRILLADLPHGRLQTDCANRKLDPEVTTLPHHIFPPDEWCKCHRSTVIAGGVLLTRVERAGAVPADQSEAAAVVSYRRLYVVVHASSERLAGSIKYRVLGRGCYGNEKPYAGNKGSDRLHVHQIRRKYQPTRLQNI